MFRRDPQDRRYRERLTGSYLASLVLHVVAAALMISVVVNSSQSGASEDAIGGTIVTVEQRAPAVARVTVPTQQAAPVPHAPTIAPVRHNQIARPAYQRQTPARPELSKIAPSAPPNPTPLPQGSPEPNVRPTLAAYETKPDVALPAVPTSVPAPVVAVAVKIPPTAAPSAAPTVAPSAKPATPKPAAPKPLPSATSVAIAKVTSAPSSSPAPAAPAAAASAPPAARQGLPSPSPTQGASTQKATGVAPSPGPSGRSSPGPRPGTAASAKPGPSRPINVRPTPKPSASSRQAIDINAKLRAMLPNNPVNPTSKTYRQDITLDGRIVPTPPPDVVALTKFIFEERHSGNEARIKMWVTNVRHVGTLTYCDGWLLRFPQSPPATATFVQPPGTHIPPANGTQIGGIPGGELPPIVEAGVTTLCSERALVPFAASPAPSP